MKAVGKLRHEIEDGRGDSEASGYSFTPISAHVAVPLSRIRSQTWTAIFIPVSVRILSEGDHGPDVAFRDPSSQHV